MAGKVTYWVTTALVVVPSLLGAVTYLAGAQQAVEGFAHVGYPQQLRVLLGIAKLLGVITILVPGFPIVKEWAYAGFTFAWIAAVVGASCDFVCHTAARPQTAGACRHGVTVFIRSECRSCSRRAATRTPAG